jgi:hypothetical protein
MHLSSGIITTNHRLRAVAVIRLRMATPAGCPPRSTGLELARMDNAISMSEWCKGRVSGTWKASVACLTVFCINFSKIWTSVCFSLILLVLPVQY